MSLTALLILVPSVFLVLFLVVLSTSAARRSHSAASVERTRVLRMRDEGKLTAAEAEELLLALRPDPSQLAPAPADRHLRAAACGLLLIGTIALALTVISSAAAIRNVQVFQEVRQGFRGSPLGGGTAGMNPQFQSEFLASMDLFHVLGIIFAFATGLIALGAWISGIILLRTADPRWRRFARAFGMTAFLAALFAFPLGTLLGGYGIWVLAIRQDSGRFF
jgi:hypothetical protein